MSLHSAEMPSRCLVRNPCTYDQGDEGDAHRDATLTVMGSFYADHSPLIPTSPQLCEQAYKLRLRHSHASLYVQDNRISTHLLRTLLLQVTARSLDAHYWPSNGPFLVGIRTLVRAGCEGGGGAS